MRKIWNPAIGVLLGLAASLPIFCLGMYFAIPYWQKHEYLQVNDWNTYLVFMYLNYGLPLIPVCAIIGFVVVKVHNWAVGPQ
jgi:hypothetical protein